MLAHPYTQRQCRAAIGPPLERAIPIADGNVDRPQLDAMRPRIAYQLRGCVETHRLAVDQRRAECRRFVMFQPGGDVDEQCEARRMRVVNNEVIGQKIVIAFDLQIVCFLTPGCLNLHDSVPINTVSWRRLGTHRRERVANLELSQLEPTRHGHEWAFTPRDNLMTDNRP